MIYKVIWADKKAKKNFDALTVGTQEQVIKSIKLLASNPRPPGVKKLSGKLQGIWRIRIRDYRLLYDIDDKSHTLILLHLDHRRQIYR